MTGQMRLLLVVSVAAIALTFGAAVPQLWADEPVTPKAQIPFGITKIFFEYNSSANDLGVHVFLDAEDWRSLNITNPNGRMIFDVEGKGSYKNLGLTEMFFEGAEPSLDEFPLEDLLGLFPEGVYRFAGKTIEKDRLVGMARLTHAIPAGPSNVSAELRAGNALIISWDPVTGSPKGFPDKTIVIAGYQVIVGAFQVTVPAGKTRVTVSPEFVESLGSGKQDFEVLAVEAGGNQSITEGSFIKP